MKFSEKLLLQGRKIYEKSYLLLLITKVFLVRNISLIFSNVPLQVTAQCGTSLVWQELISAQPAGKWPANSLSAVDC